MEKGRDKCSDSPTIEGERIKGTIAENICKSGVYDEGMIRDEVHKILIFS